MNLIEIIREPSVACPETGETVLLCECERCQHFYGYNTGETKIGCVYDLVETGKEDTLPEETGKEDTLPEETGKEDTLPEETGKEDTLPEETGKEEVPGREVKP